MDVEGLGADELWQSSGTDPVKKFNSKLCSIDSSRYSGYGTDSYVVVVWEKVRQSPTLVSFPNPTGGRTSSTNLSTAVVLYQTTHVKH